MREIYSELVFLKEENIEKFEEIIKKWKKGTKIYFFSDNIECIKKFAGCYKNNLGYLKNFEEFNGKKQSYFNLEVYKINQIKENPFSIIDGEILENNKELEKIIEGTNFNLEQYKIEHESIDKDILVRAKAGTGKTYSMIARINFLIFKRKYKAHEIKENICAITFTNEATFNMKKRLKEYYKNLYILTNEMEYLEVLEGIENIKISTIHSFFKEIVDKTAIPLELGDNIKIYSGKDELKKIILEEIDTYKLERYKDKNLLIEMGLDLYNIEKIIYDILEKIEEKNVRISEEYNLGEESDIRIRLINRVLRRTQERIISNSKEINKIRLKEHVILTLEGAKSTNLNEYISMKYLFIDEFQDTDDMQINILNKLRKILDFRMFVVGDSTQAIYRFRGAKYTAFNKIDRNKLDLKEFNLVKNYRTGDNLLNKINIIFKRAEKYLDYGESVESTKQDNKSDIEEHKGSIVNLIKLLRRNKKEETIAVLARSRGEVKKLDEIFRRNKIYVKTTEAKNIYEHKATGDLYKLVLAMKLNKEPVYLFNLENTNYTTKVTDKEYLFSIKNNREKKLEYFKKLNLIEGFEEFLERLGKEPVMKVLREIKRKTKPWLLEEVAEYRVEYKDALEQLFEIIIEKYNGEYLTLNKVCNFLEIALNTNSVEQLRSSFQDGEEGEIICSTVHKVKGLEFDNIIIPYANNSIIRENDRLEVIVDKKDIGYRWKSGKLEIENDIYEKLEKVEKKEQIGEEVRILYVAITRAKKKIYWMDQNKKRIKLSWKGIIEASL